MTDAKTIAFVACILSASAHAQIHVQPTEIIHATPLTSFSERLGSWPSNSVPGDLLQTEIEPIERGLNTIPGIKARSSGSQTISIRGSSQAGRTLTLFDGTPLVLGDGFGTPRILVPQEIQAETRLIKGPASVFYGPSAMMGALNHIPRVFEQPAIRLSMDTQGKGVATRSADGILPYRWGEQKQNFIQDSLHYEYDPGDYPFSSSSSGKSGDRDSNNHQLLRNTLIGHQKTKRWTLDERFIYADSSGATPGPISAPSPAPFESRAHLASLGARYTFSDSTDAGVQLSQIRTKYLYNSGTASESPSELTRELISTDLNHVFENSVGVKTFFDVSHDQIRATGINEAIEMKDAFELGQVWQVPLGNGWSVQPGARWLTHFQKVLAAASVEKKWNDERSWLTYSEGFRRPSLYDLYYTDSTSLANPNLQPENASQFELGYSHKPDLIESAQNSLLKRLSWSIVVYQINYRNIFSSQPTSPTQATRVNNGNANGYGAEAGIGLNEASRTYSLSYNYLETRNTTVDQPLTLSPRHQLTASFTQGLGPIFFEVRDTYTGAFYDQVYGASRLTSLPETNLVDLNITSLGLTDWEFKTGVLNVFNKPYELTIGYPEPQRTFYLSALHYF